MKYLFFVQSEGRGHLTQALSVSESLRKQGHEIIGVVMNQNPLRTIPDFFVEGVGAPIHYIKSPYFLVNKEGTGIDFRKSVLFNVLRLSSYIHSLKTIHKLYKKNKPDVVINFFEPLGNASNSDLPQIPQEEAEIMLREISNPFPTLSFGIVTSTEVI